MNMETWKDSEGRLWARPLVTMNYHNRLYYWEIEEKYHVKFRTKKYQLKGKQQDGITQAQKRKLWALGVNVTGIVYKGTAIEIIKFVESLRFPKPTTLYQVIYSLNGKNYGSKILFPSVSEAEYETGKCVPPKYDAKIVQYRNTYYQTIDGRCFSSEEAAAKTKKEFRTVR